jgi:hypothetical protein
MKTNNQNSSSQETRTFEFQIAKVADASKRYSERGEAQFDSLINYGRELHGLHSEYNSTPRNQREHKSWSKFFEHIAEIHALSCKTSRMADLYIALHKDVESIGVGKVKASVVDGSYRGVRAAANKLLGKIAPKPAEHTATTRLRRALKELEAAESLLPTSDHAKLTESKNLLSELITIQATRAEAASGQKLAETFKMPPEWCERLSKANENGDQVALNGVIDELCKTLESGGAVGFPEAVTFKGKVTDLKDLMPRHVEIKKYLRQVRQMMKLNFAMPVFTEARGEGGTTRVSAFKPKDVREIATAIGGQTALGKAVGKENGHASYWVRQNKFPADLMPKLVEAFAHKGQKLDLSQIQKPAGEAVTAFTKRVEKMRFEQVAALVAAAHFYLVARLENKDVPLSDFFRIG